MSIPVFNYDIQLPEPGLERRACKCPHCAVDTVLMVPAEGEVTATPGCAHYVSYAYNPVGSGYECNFTDAA